MVNLVVGYLLYGVLGFDSTIGFALSVAVAFISGMGVSFILNRRFHVEPFRIPLALGIAEAFGIAIHEWAFGLPRPCPTREMTR